MTPRIPHWLPGALVAAFISIGGLVILLGGAS